METEDIGKITDLLRPVFLKNNIQKAVVFGSVGRGSSTKKSDLDLMIIMDTNRRFFDRYDAFDDIYRLVKGCTIDMLIYTPDELNDISHRPFIKKILEEGKTIYEH